MARKSVDEELKELEEQIKKKKNWFKKRREKLLQKKESERNGNLIKLGAVVDERIGGYRDGDEDRLAAFLDQQDERGSYFQKAMRGFLQQVQQEQHQDLEDNQQGLQQGQDQEQGTQQQDQIQGQGQSQEQ